MNEKKENYLEGEASRYEFPLDKGVPLPPEVVVDAIGRMGRRYSPEGKDDLPKKVVIQTKDGRIIETTLENIYCDGGSQADGTFYFSEKVRNDGRVKDNYLFGREIESITFE